MADPARSPWSSTCSLAPKLGSATLIGLVLCGQIPPSTALDHFGLVGFERHPITAGRVAGVALMIAGVALVRRHCRDDPAAGPAGMDGAAGLG